MWPLLLALGCAPPDDDTIRRAQLQTFLFQDNRIWLERDPALLASKFDRMERDPYDFMRGTAGLLLADMGRVGIFRSQTSFVDTGEAANVLLVGDPHPENLGTSRWVDDPDSDEPGLAWEWVDLDAVRYGAWIVDIRRAAQGLGVLLLPMSGCDQQCRDSASRSLVTGYVAALNDADPRQSSFLAERLDEALDEGGLERKRIREARDPDDPTQLVVDNALDDDTSGLLPLTTPERSALRLVLDRYQRAPEGFRVLDAARRFGRGVASRPAMRFEVLWDRGDDGPADDDLIEIREAIDPPAGPGLAGPLWNDNAQRLDDASERLWTRPDADPRFDGVRTGNRTWRVRSRSSWFQGLDHEKAVEEWDEGARDVDALAHQIGFLLGEAHARGSTPVGEPAGPVILGDIAGETDALADEIAAAAALDVDRVRQDHALFLQLRETHGPLVGVDIVAKDTP